MILDASVRHRFRGDVEEGDGEAGVGQGEPEG